MSSYDVIIIGGGPTGLSAASTVTEKAGLKTIVLEEHSKIGNPLACGEGISVDKLLTLKNMPRDKSLVNEETLKFQEPESFIEQTINYQRFFFGSKGVATSKLNTVTIDRPLFDQLMARNAKSNGVKLQLNSQVIGIDKKNNILEVKTEKESYSAPIVIGCDGPSAHSVKMMGLAPPSEYVQGVEYKIEGVHTDALDFYFNFEELPSMHYGWLFPKKSHTNIGIVANTMSKPMAILNHFIDYLDNPAIKKSKIIKKIAGIIPASGPIPKKFCNNYMVAGDAAGMTNTLFYGGVAIGIHTGMLAGETAIVAHDLYQFDEEVLIQYQNKCDSYPYSDPTIQQAHQILYNEMSPSDLEAFGSLIDGWDITTFNRIQKFVLFLKALTKPSLLKRINEMRKIAYGFSKSRDWGF